MSGPLEGLKVVDLTRILAGPYCTMTLGDLGADVIKIERPDGGDTARGNGPFIGDISSYFLSVNRGKKSVTLNLASDRGRELLKRLITDADVLVENYVPGVMKRFGLDYEAVAPHNPRLVYCSISGFGQTGPYAGRPALDVVVQGMGGIMSITGEPGGPPVRPGASMGDVAAGMYAATGIVAALFERSLSGRGQYIDIGMLDCQIAIQENAFARYFGSGEVPKALGTRHPVFTPFQAFETSDSWMVLAIIGGVTDQWPLFCATIDRIDLIDEPDFATGGLRTEHYDRLEPILSTELRKRTTDEWVEAFQAVDIACGPVNTIDKVVQDPQVNHREMVIDVPDDANGSIRLVNTPLKLSRTPGRVTRVSPQLGEHTEAVLGEALGLTVEEVELLRRDGVV